MLELSTCSRIEPDLCASAQPPILPSAEAYAQYVPVETWDLGGVSPAHSFVSLTDAVAGARLDTGTFALLYGISLADELGPWPSSRRGIEGSSDFDDSAQNGARWVDVDADGALGLTIKLVGPGGASATETSGPPLGYGALSSACPRQNPQAQRSPYAFLPLAQGIGVKRIRALHGAQRMLAELHGELQSCDRIIGELTGPNGGSLQLENILGGCSGSSDNDSGCSAQVLDAAAMGGASGLTLATGELVMARVTESTTCAQVRAQVEL
jgi:hypothetical protein